MNQLVKDCIDDARHELIELNDEIDNIEKLKKDLLFMIGDTFDSYQAQQLLYRIIMYHCSRSYTEGYIAGLSLLEEEE